MGGDRQPRRSLVGRSLLQPQRRTICRAPLLGFKCEPCPGACNVEQNVLHSHVGCTLGHLTAFSGAISASFRCKHGNAPRGSIASKCPKAKPRRGGPAGVEAWQDLGGLGGVPTKSTFQVGISVNRSKEFRPCLLSLVREILRWGASAGRPQLAPPEPPRPPLTSDCQG